MKIIIMSTLLCFVLIFSATYCLKQWLNYPILEMNRHPIKFIIITNSSINSVAQQIIAANIQLNHFLFILLTYISGNSKYIHSGKYELKAGTTPLCLLKQLVHGQSSREILTIIEGWNFCQMRQAIAKHTGLKHDTVFLSDYELLKKITNKYITPEGLFFPDTYLFYKGTSDLKIYRQAFLLMQKYLAKAWYKHDVSLPYKSLYDVLIMASIIEKETGQKNERKLIAGVFINRLKSGMFLQTDPAIIYGKSKCYKNEIRKSDLLTDTPYNTYIRKGMPPTPIALPSAASLFAAVNPIKTKALYFVARGDGTSHFSNNLNEHNLAVNKYQR